MAQFPLLSILTFVPLAGAFIILVFRQGLNLKLIKTAVLEGLVSSAMLFMITIGAMILRTGVWAAIAWVAGQGLLPKE